MAKKKTQSMEKTWDVLWQEYSELLKKWFQNLESIQKVGSEIQSKYNEVILKGTNESSKKTMEEFHKNWQKSMNNAALEAYKQFDKNWQNITNQSGIEQLKVYGELMNSFAKTWQKMWQK